MGAFKDMEYHLDMMTDEPSAVRAIRYIVTRELSLKERRILFTYAGKGSYREAAKMLGCSHMTVARDMRAIQKKVKEILKNIDIDDL
ncbi:MAG: helix-turn-helix domain-containing protein [Bacteroidales bacterium]|nr:helix-turn-helix domain-containing protein [Bacteroidales bacterium]